MRRGEMLGIKHLGAPLPGVTIENTNRCPNDCLYCSRSAVMKRKKRDMSLTDFGKIVRSIKDSSLTVPSTWIHLGFAGEPLMHKNIARQIDMVFAAGYQRVMVYSSLMCSRQNFDAFLKNVRTKWLGTVNKGGVHVRTASHLWQAGKVPITRAEFYRRCQLMRRAMGFRQSFACLVPRAEMIESETAAMAKGIGINVGSIRGRIASDTFSLHGLEPRTEVMRGTPCQARGRHIMIDGEFTLCCLDQKPEVWFGNVFKDGFLNAWVKKCRFFDALRCGSSDYPKHCKGCKSFPTFKSQIKKGFIR